MGSRSRTRVRGLGFAVGAVLVLSVVAAPPVSAAAVDVEVLTSLPVKALPPVGISDAGVVAVTMLEPIEHVSTPVFWDGATAVVSTPPGAGGGSVLDINGAGTSAGFSYFGGIDKGHAWVRSADGAFTVEAVGGGVTSLASAINEHGLVLVQLTQAGVKAPALWSPPAAPTPIMQADPLSSGYNPQFLNDAGQVVAGYPAGPGQPTIFWDPTTPDVTTTIAPPAGFTATPTGLAEDGSVLFSATDGSTTIAYLWKAGATTPISGAGYPDPQGVVLDPENGHVAGVSHDTGFVWTAAGGFRPLTCPVADQPINVLAVNAGGYATGACGIDDGAKDQHYEPFVWTPTGAAQGLGVTAPLLGGAGYVIDDAGRVAGLYDEDRENHEQDPFLATVVFAPSAPRSLAGTAGNATVDLTWSPPVDDGFQAPTSYRIYADGLLVATTSGATTISLGGLTNGAAVSYRVTAVNAGGVSAASNAISLTPAAPAIVPATVSPVIPAVAVVVQPAFTG